MHKIIKNLRRCFAIYVEKSLLRIASLCYFINKLCITLINETRNANTAVYGFFFFFHYRPPEGRRLYDMKVKSSCAFLRSYNECQVQPDALSVRRSFAHRERVVERDQL